MALSDEQLQQVMLEAPKKYLDAITRGDIDAVLELYAEDVVLEDPVGSEPYVGKAAVSQFYDTLRTMGLTMSLQGDVRVAGREVAFPFYCHADVEGATMETRIIDIFRFNDDGKIDSMRAFWGPANASIKE